MRFFRSPAVSPHSGQMRHFVALSVQAHPRLCSEFQVLHPEVCDFLHATAGVVQQQQECAVAERVAAVGWQLMKERFDLVPVEKAGFGRRDAFTRNCGDLLCDRKALRRAPPQKLEERMEDGQPMVACAPMIVALVFQVLEESQDAIERQRFEGDLRQPARHIACEECEKQPQRIAISLDRARPKALLQREFVGEESVKQRAKRRRTHDLTLRMSGSAQCSKR